MDHKHFGEKITHEEYIEDLVEALRTTTNSKDLYWILSMKRFELELNFMALSKQLHDLARDHNGKMGD